jgi:hypothetical protein
MMSVVLKWFLPRGPGRRHPVLSLSKHGWWASQL